jgi:hypothetical protein
MLGIGYGPFSRSLATRIAGELQVRPGVRVRMEET